MERESEANDKGKDLWVNMFFIKKFKNNIFSLYNIKCFLF